MADEKPKEKPEHEAAETPEPGPILIPDEFGSSYERKGLEPDPSLVKKIFKGFIRKSEESKGDD